eukprot:1159557-Pelagomonas_calceolata.AAC.6
MGPICLLNPPLPVLLLVYPQGLEAAESTRERPLIVAGQVPNCVEGGGRLALEALELCEVICHACGPFPSATQP